MSGLMKEYLRSIVTGQQADPISGSIRGYFDLKAKRAQDALKQRQMSQRERELGIKEFDSGTSAGNLDARRAEFEQKLREYDEKPAREGERDKQRRLTNAIKPLGSFGAGVGAPVSTPWIDVAKRTGRMSLMNPPEQSQVETPANDGDIQRQIAEAQKAKAQYDIDLARKRTQATAGAQQGSILWRKRTEKKEGITTASVDAARKRQLEGEVARLDREKRRRQEQKDLMGNVVNQPQLVGDIEAQQQAIQQELQQLTGGQALDPTQMEAALDAMIARGHDPDQAHFIIYGY